MHVGDLDGVSVRNGRFWEATVIITILDSNGGTVSGATVDGSWSIGGAASCVTNGTGTCSILNAGLTRQQSPVDFTVTNVTGSLTYNPADNTDPDGDSDGTTISLTRP